MRTLDLLFEARRRTHELVLTLAPYQRLGPQLRIVNPAIWEYGHLGWFQEKWLLRHLRDREPLRPDADCLYDSAAVAHETRWNLPYPTWAETRSYVHAVLKAVLTANALGDPTGREAYFLELALFHEDMHGEAFLYTRQTHGWRAPDLVTGAAVETGGGACPGLVDIPGGTFEMGSPPGEDFVWDNEKWAHPVTLAPFRIARAPVTNAEFAEFVEAGGYRKPEIWSDQGRAWLATTKPERPWAWEPHLGGGWWRRSFDRLVPLEDLLPVMHVCWYEADAWCRWKGRRLPTEAEWEMAAGCVPGSTRAGVPLRRHRFPWGESLPEPHRACLDLWRPGPVAVGALPAGDSPCGCRQMLGNVWEWTASTFLPYPGFAPDPYREYSEPWFGTQKVLRGGCFATRARLVDVRWRNFFTPDRRDIFAGFRTAEDL